MDVAVVGCPKRRGQDRIVDADLRAACILRIRSSAEDEHAATARPTSRMTFLYCIYPASELLKNHLTSDQVTQMTAADTRHLSNACCRHETFFCRRELCGTFRQQSRT